MDMAEDNTNEGATPLSGKDIAVLVTLATFGAMMLGIAVYGYQGLVDKCTKSEFWDLICVLLFFATVIGMITYLLVYLTAHYLVYLAIRILLSLLDPVNPQRVNRNINRLFDKTKEK